MADFNLLPFHAPPGGVWRLKSADGPPLASSNVSPALTIDKGGMSVEAVICTPLMDHQGDVVDPEGVDLGVHKLNPVVFYDHRSGKSPHILPIGKSEDPSGNYSVRLAHLPGRGPALVAKTFFSQRDRFASEVFALVAEDILRGTSIGFAPGRVEKGQPSPVDVLERPRGGERGAFHFRRSILHEYSHTPAPTNPEALTVKVEKANYRSTCPELYRALQPLLVKGGATVTVPRNLETKAMDDQLPTGDMPAEPMPDAAPESDLPPEATEAYDGGQLLTDLAQRYRDLSAKTLHPSSRKQFAKWADKLDAMAAEKVAHGESVEGEIGGGDDSSSDAPSDPPADDSDSDSDDSDPDDTDTYEPVEKSADGSLIIKSGYQPKRWTLAETKGVPSPIAGPVDPKLAASIERRIRALEKRTTRTR